MKSQQPKITLGAKFRKKLAAYKLMRQAVLEDGTANRANCAVLSLGQDRFFVNTPSIEIKEN